MFFKLIQRNSRHNRQDNGIYFAAMIITIIAFYMILSLSSSDVMIFLQNMEGEALHKMLLLTNIFYAFSLFILFFLVYFAGNIQIERRYHEFGVYLSLGMTRSRLFKLLFLEDIYNNIVALVIGLTIAILFSDLISLITAKAVGLGIIGHHFSLSGKGLAKTILGFLVVKLIAFLIFSFKILRQGIGQLLRYRAEGQKQQLGNFIYAISAMPTP